jgi:hypothetical protein
LHNLGIEPLSVKEAAITKRFDAEDAYLAFRFAYYSYFSKEAIYKHMTPWSHQYDATFLSWMDNCHSRKTKTNDISTYSTEEQLIDDFNKKCPD